jgi:uncharacterized protein
MAVFRRELLLAAVVAATAALGAAALWAVKPHRAPAPMAAAAFQADAAEPLRSDVPSAASLAAAVRSFIPADPVPIAAPALRAPGDAPAWQRNAVAAIDAGGRPMIAVVIDDLGLDRRNTERVIRLPGPLTLSFMTYASDVAEQAREGRRHGHELLVHVPMQPDADGLDAGFNVLRTDLPPAELARRIDWALSRFDGYVGINNHMGSRFTASDAGMAALFAELHRRGLLFFDSRTTVATLGDAMAARFDVPFARRNVFLDNETASAAVDVALAKVEVDARRNGFAIAIGHPHDGTVAALAAWLPTLRERGFMLVPISQIVRRNLAAAGQTASNWR